MKGSLKKFLAMHKTETELRNNKVVCTLTGHEMPMDVEVLQKYWSGKAIQRARRKAERAAFDLSEFGPHIIPDSGRPDTHVYCALTKQSLNRDREEILMHVEGRRFKHRLSVYEAKREREANGDMDKDGDDESDEEDDDSHEAMDYDDAAPAASKDSDDSEDEGDEPQDDEPNDMEEQGNFWVRGASEVPRPPEVSQKPESGGKRRREGKALKLKEKKAQRKQKLLGASS